MVVDDLHVVAGGGQRLDVGRQRAVALALDGAALAALLDGRLQGHHGALRLRGETMADQRIGRGLLQILVGEGLRSEERRVGKECRSRWSAYHKKKKTESTWKHDRAKNKASNFEANASMKHKIKAEL